MNAKIFSFHSESWLLIKIENELEKEEKKKKAPIHSILIIEKRQKTHPKTSSLYQEKKEEQE